MTKTTRPGIFQPHLLTRAIALGTAAPAQAVNFNLLKEGRTRKVKGPRDAGDITVTCAHDPLSASQAAMVGFAGTSYSYAFKVVLADAADANDTDSTFYFAGKVMSARLAAGETTTERRRTFSVGIDTEVLTINRLEIGA